MKAFKFVLTLTTLVAVFSTCTENDSVEPEPIFIGTEDVPLTDAELTFLETVKDTIIHLEDIILENGESVRSFLEINDPAFLQTYPSGRVDKKRGDSPRQQKNMFLSRMMGAGTFLVDRTRHVYAAAGTDTPFQFGLAYSWGSKDYEKRQTPPGGTGECKNLKIHGLDCSGMIWAMTQASFLPPVVPQDKFSVANITNASKWTEAFKASADYKALRMKNIGQVTMDKMKNGDLILWGSHVGIYLNGYFYQSNGSSKLPACNNNLALSKGPRLISLSEVLKWGLGKYTVFRIVIDLEFKFEMKFTTKDRLTGGLISKAFEEWDSTSMKIEIKEIEINEGTVTCSNIFNSMGTVTPETLTDLLGCSSTQVVPDGFIGKGPMHVTSTTGTYLEGEQRLVLYIIGTLQAPAFQWKCSAIGGAELFPSQSAPLSLALLLNATDRVTTYSSGAFFARLTPVD